MNFSLMNHHHYSLSEIDNMLPWEKQVFVMQLVDWLEKEKLRLEQEARNRP